MYRTPKPLVLLAAVAALVASGCKESPTAPESPEPPTVPPPPAVMTPVSAVITSISITDFPATKTDGSDWDLSLIAEDRRPDLYAIVQAGTQTPDFTSSTFSNAMHNHTYVFTNGLPITLAYDSSRRVNVMDDDFGSADDRLGWITLNLPAAYRGDNSSILNYDYTDSGRRLTVWIQGTWNY